MSFAARPETALPRSVSVKTITLSVFFQKLKHRRKDTKVFSAFICLILPVFGTKIGDQSQNLCSVKAWSKWVIIRMNSCNLVQNTTRLRYLENLYLHQSLNDNFEWSHNSLQQFSSHIIMAINFAEDRILLF